jgi:hypothetical protein
VWVNCPYSQLGPSPQSASLFLTMSVFVAIFMLMSYSLVMSVHVHEPRLSDMLLSVEMGRPEGMESDLKSDIKMGITMNR